MEQKNKITTSELEKLIKVEKRSIRSHIDNGILPIPKYPQYPETEMYWEKKEIAKILGIEEIPDEPFLEAAEAMELLGINNVMTLHQRVNRGKIPAYRLKKAKGHKFLFLKSEIDALKKFSWYNMGENFVDFFSANIFLKAIFEELLSPVIIRDLTEGEKKVVYDVLVQRKTMDAIGKEAGFSRERIRQIFQQACKRIYYRIKLVPNKLAVTEDLIKENDRLRAENKTLRELTHQHKLVVDEKVIDILSTKIEDVGFSERVRKIFSSGDIKTLGDLISYSRFDIMKFRNFGANSLKEVEDFLYEHNLKLKDERKLK